MRSSSTLSFSPYHCSLGLVAGELLASEDNVGARSDLLRLEVRLTSPRDVSSCVSGPVQVWRNLSGHGLSLSLRIHSVLPEKFCFLHI